MPFLLTLLTLLVGLSIVFLPLSTGFFPKLGLMPLKLGHRKSTRLVQVTSIWGLAAGALWTDHLLWGWIAAGMALWFTVVALNFFPQRIFADLAQPARSQDGLSDSAPVLAVEVQGVVVAYPLEMIVPHHIVNDIIGESPVLVTW
jgi:hypothetical protein